MVGVGGEKQRYKLTPGIRSSSGTRNSNKLLVDGGCCTQVLRGVGRRRRRRERIPLWNGDRASDGLVHSIPENLSVFILALGISLEILHTHTQKAIAHLSNMNLLYRLEPYLPTFVSLPLSFSSFLPLLSSFEIQVESH